MRSRLDQIKKVAQAGLGLASACAAALWLAQRHPAPFGTSHDVSAGLDDEATLDRIARSDAFDAYADANVVTFPLANGAAMLELFRIADATHDKPLTHVSPIVRLANAYHIARARPEKLARLRPLLTDAAPVALASFGDHLDSSTVRDVTLALLCVRSDRKEARALLEEASRDVRNLAAWPLARRCLKGG